LPELMRTPEPLIPDRLEIVRTRPVAAARGKWATFFTAPDAVHPKGAVRLAVARAPRQTMRARSRRHHDPDSHQDLLHRHARRGGPRPRLRRGRARPRLGHA